MGKPKPKTSTERSHRYRRRQNLLAKADTLNRLGTQALDKLIETGVPVITYLRFSSQELGDLDLWAEACGERLDNLTEAQRLALEAWLWDRYDRARLPVGVYQLERRKPKKSPKDDAPWPEARKWFPRRWFGPGQSGPPLTISTARAVGIRAQLDAEYEGEAFEAEFEGESFVEVPSQTVRNHPNLLRVAALTAILTTWRIEANCICTFSPLAETR